MKTETSWKYTFKCVGENWHGDLRCLSFVKWIFRSNQKVFLWQVLYSCPVPFHLVSAGFGDFYDSLWKGGLSSHVSRKQRRNRLGFLFGFPLWIVWFCNCLLLTRVFGVCIFRHYPDHIQTDNGLWYPCHVLCSASVLPCISIGYSIKTDRRPTDSHTWRLMYICRQWV